MVSDAGGDQRWSTEWQGDPAPPAPESPAGDVAPGATTGPDPTALAGFWIRFLGVVVDAIVLSLLVGWTRNQAISFVVSAAYFTYLHATPAGQTVGNRVCGIRVVDVRGGGNLDYGRALIRFLMSYVSGVVIALGYLWMLWDPLRQTWHDKVANSVVVKADRYPPPAPFGRAR
jgi:uncharacterized RDD family membrane protein YckC